MTSDLSVSAGSGQVRTAPAGLTARGAVLDATIILQILWTSLATSSYYVLFAVAFSLVLKVTRLFNFAQAAIMTVAFYTAFVAVQWLQLPGGAGVSAPTGAGTPGA